MTPSRVAVVVVNFNAGSLLKDCLASALASPLTAEVAVVDNASQDESVAEAGRLAAGDPRVRLIENRDNRGFARACNQGLAATTAEYVLFLNPDCRLEPGCLERTLEVLEGHSAAGMAGCLILNPDGSEQTGCRRETPTPGKAMARAFGLDRLLGVQDYVLAGQPLPAGPTEVEAISGAFMLVRRKAITQVGPLDERYFLHCEDLDWCLRFRQGGWSILFVPDATVTHVKGASSRARPVRVLWHMHLGMIRYYRKFFRRAYPAPLFWLVTAAVALRFMGLSALAILRPRNHGPA